MIKILLSIIILSSMSVMAANRVATGVSVTPIDTIQRGIYQEIQYTVVLKSAIRCYTVDLPLEDNPDSLKKSDYIHRIYLVAQIIAGRADYSIETPIGFYGIVWSTVLVTATVVPLVSHNVKQSYQTGSYDLTGRKITASVRAQFKLLTRIK